jgi:hypothetical protein
LSNLQEKKLAVNPLFLLLSVSLCYIRQKKNVFIGKTEYPPLTVLNSSLETVLAKMASATDCLAETDDIEMSRQLVLLIKDCADCVQSLKSASSMHQ